MELIKNDALVQDSFQHVPDTEPLPQGDVIVSLDRFGSEGDALLARPGRVGVRVRSDQTPDILAAALPQLAVVAIEFPKYVDGRGYSIARLLRERMGFEGELRAVGNVLRDQLFYMRRCGFNAFELEPGKDVTDALEAFKEYSVVYQAAADQPLPLFRRR